MAAERWDIVHSIGGALPGATVITAQYCQAGWRASARRWPSRLVGSFERTCRQINTWSAIRNERRAASHPALRALIGVSRSALEEWRAHYHASAAVGAVVPNGVDLARFRPGGAADHTALRASLGMTQDARIALLVGAIVLLLVARRHMLWATQVQNLIAGRSYVTIIDEYRDTSGVLPSSLSQLDLPAWATEDHLDAWGRPFVYEVKSDGFVLVSYGRDGLPDGTDYWGIRDTSAQKGRSYQNICYEWDADQLFSDLGGHRACGK